MNFGIDRRHVVFRFAAGAAIATLGGCAVSAPPVVPAVAPAVASPLLGLELPPATFGRDAAFDQQVAASFDGREISIRFRVEISRDELSLVGLSPIGSPLVELRFDGHTIEAKGQQGKALPFDPRYLLADFQIAFWPSGPLREALAKAGLGLEEDAGRKFRRVVADNGDVLATASFRAVSNGVSTVELEHSFPAYTLLIRSSETQD